MQGSALCAWWDLDTKTKMLLRCEHRGVIGKDGMRIRKTDMCRCRSATGASSEPDRTGTQDLPLNRSSRSSSTCQYRRAQDQQLFNRHKLTPHCNTPSVVDCPGSCRQNKRNPWIPETHGVGCDGPLHVNGMIKGASLHLTLPFMPPRPL